jgi:hypothetical protein
MGEPEHICAAVASLLEEGREVVRSMRVADRADDVSERVPGMLLRHGNAFGIVYSTFIANEFSALQRSP